MNAIRAEPSWRVYHTTFRMVKMKPRSERANSSSQESMPTRDQRSEMQLACLLGWPWTFALEYSSITEGPLEFFEAA